MYFLLIGNCAFEQYEITYRVTRHASTLLRSRLSKSEKDKPLLDDTYFHIFAVFSHCEKNHPFTRTIQLDLEITSIGFY